VTLDLPQIIEGVVRDMETWLDREYDENRDRQER
jgi:hypothetical protein